MCQIKHIFGPEHLFVAYEINRSGQVLDFVQDQWMMVSGMAGILGLAVSWLQTGHSSE